MNDLSAWHALSAQEVADTFEVDAHVGLSENQVFERARQYGPNALRRGTSLRTLRILLRLLSSPLSLVLLVAGILAMVLGEWVDTVVVLIVLVVNIAVGAFQEGRARKVFETLQKTQTQYAVVLRDGRKQRIEATQVVPGDILVVEGGIAVSADARLLRAEDLSVNESALTGEWEAVSKVIGELAADTPLAERENMLWSGTSVSTGYGSAVVVATGRNTELGKLAKQVTEEDGETKLQKDIRTLARILMVGVTLIAGAIVLISILQGHPLADALFVGIALAVAVMPEGLPAAVTVVLAVGMERILKKKGLVRSLLAAETLGSTTYIITDKTGTLTEGRMSLAALYTARGMVQKDSSPHFEDNRRALTGAILAADALVSETGEGVEVHGRPIDRALISAGLEEGISQEELFVHGNPRLAYVQFESVRRYGASLNTHEGRGNRLYINGSPEVLLGAAKHVMVAGASRPMDASTKERFEDIQEAESAQGHRCIAVAYAQIEGDEIPSGVRTGAQLPHNLVFAGLLAFSDTIRTDVPEQIASAHDAGITVLMATGDFPGTARAVAHAVGIAAEDSQVVTGTDIEKMDDAALLSALLEKRVFARVLPEQKLRMVRILRGAGEIVAMTGDGVNDAPALVSADIGMAVESGTDVAKEASDMVLLNNSFSTITAAIAEGRRIGDNLRRIVGYLLSTGFSEVFIIVGALVVGAPLPLLPTQILWANVIQEGVLSFPFAFEPAERGSMKRRAKEIAKEPVFSKRLQGLVAVTALTTGTLILCIYALLSYLETPIEEIRTVLFISLSVDSLLYMFSFKDLHRPIWQMNLLSNWWVVGAVGISIGLLMVSLTFPPLMTLLSLTPLSMIDITLLVLLGIANVLTIEFAKKKFFGRG